MSGNSGPVGLEEVRRQELEEILLRRREAASGSASAPENPTREQVADELVGLALSGGGNRSASFNLGLIQALQENDLLRQADYLSTVSGGGYVGSSLSALILHPETTLNPPSAATPPSAEKNAPPNGPREAINGQPRGKAGAPENRFPWAVEPDGRQPPRIRELIHGGAYLRRPLLFLNRFLIGVALINVVTISGVFAVAAFAAWLFRSLDHADMIDRMYALGFRGDIQRAFFPAALCLAMWLATWIISYWRRGALAPGRIARWFLTLMMASVLVALAALIGTGDISLNYLKEQYGIEPPSAVVNKLGADLKYVFLIALCVALLPYLRLKDLIRSGTKPKNAVEGWIFAIASRSLFYGLPLLLFALLARENISNFNERRVVSRHGVEFNTQYDLVPLEIKDWNDMWRNIELQAAGYVPGAPLDQQADGGFPVSGRVWEVANALPAGARGQDVLASLRALKTSAELDAGLPFWRRWFLFAARPVIGDDDDVTKQYRARVEYRELTGKICERLNRQVLRDPSFYRSVVRTNLETLELSEIEEGRIEQQKEALCAQAKQLEVLAAIPSGQVKFREWLDERWRLLESLRQGEDQERKELVDQTVSELKRHQQAGEERWTQLESDLTRLNWSLLKLVYGEAMTKKSTVFARVVLASDQKTRLAWAGWAALVFLLSAGLVNLNATSMHGYYRNCLSEMWLIGLPGMGRSIPLARLETTSKGAPYQILNATVHLKGKYKEKEKPSSDVFLFTRAYCGSDRTGYLPTDAFGDGAYDLANAMAVSGAAVTPSQVHNPLLALLLLLSNSRLGQWLPNPGAAPLLTMPQGLRWWLHKVGPVPLRLMLDLGRPAERRDFCFVSDGGHLDNLGLRVLLARRCRVIIVSDATCDPESNFRYFMTNVRWARMEHGIEFHGLGEMPEDLGLTRLCPDPKTKLARKHWIAARINYPANPATGEEAMTGLLVILKPSFTGDEEIDLVHYRAEAAAFPHDPTADQFYDPDKFESYRELGYHIGLHVAFELREFLQTHPELATGLSRWVDSAATTPPAAGLIDREPRPRNARAGITRSRAGRESPQGR